MTAGVNIYNINDTRILNAHIFTQAYIFLAHLMWEVVDNDDGGTGWDMFLFYLPAGKRWVIIFLLCSLPPPIIHDTALIAAFLILRYPIVGEPHIYLNIVKWVHYRCSCMPPLPHRLNVRCIVWVRMKIPNKTRRRTIIHTILNGWGWHDDLIFPSPK